MRASLLLLALLAACGEEPESPRRTFASDVERCAAHLRELHRALVEEGWTPAPGTPISAVHEDAACPEDGSPYAERDLAAYPLERFPTRGTEILLACPSHDGTLNALYADGSVKTFSLAQEIELGVLPAGTEKIPVGEGSPLEELRRSRPRRPS